MTSEEYYDLLKKAYDQVDWSSRDSIHRYNEYARQLRKEVEWGHVWK